VGRQSCSAERHNRTTPLSILINRVGALRWSLFLQASCSERHSSSQCLGRRNGSVTDLEFSWDECTSRTNGESGRCACEEFRRVSPITGSISVLCVKLSSSFASVPARCNRIRQISISPTTASLSSLTPNSRNPAGLRCPGKPGKFLRFCSNCRMPEKSVHRLQPSKADELNSSKVW
jgi:hypothetical protein